MGSLLPPCDNDIIVTAVTSIAREVCELRDNCQQNGLRGRPRLQFAQEQLVALFEIQFSSGDIASILYVSPRTVRRRIIQYGLEDEGTYSEMGDASLDAVTERFVRVHPNSSETSLSGFLRSLSPRVQRYGCLMRVGKFSIADNTACVC